jgi:hypothetical protein
MKIEAFVLVQAGCEPCVSQKPWETAFGKWYKLTAEVPDPIPVEEVPAVVTEFP